MCPPRPQRIPNKTTLEDKHIRPALIHDEAAQTNQGFLSLRPARIFANAGSTPISATSPEATLAKIALDGIRILLHRNRNSVANRLR
ncbi:hypothetical protein AB1N83_013051 [Pleurotus pulmonarius]